MLGLLLVFALVPGCSLHAADPAPTKVSSEAREMEIACAIINGHINDPALCNRLQRKQVQAMCDKGDPNACKALKVVRDGKDEEAIEEKKLEDKNREEQNTKKKTKA